MKQFDGYATGGNGSAQWAAGVESLEINGQAVPVAAVFPPGYQHDFSPVDACADYALLQSLGQGDDIALRLYQQAGDDSSIVRFRVMRRHSAIALSDVLPLLENFGLRVLGEKPYCLDCGQEGEAWLHVFELETRGNFSAAVEQLAPAFEAAFRKVWDGAAESDLFNQLVFTCGADWRSTAMLRAYSRYMKQIGLHYTRPFIANTLASHPEISRLLVALFSQRFEPSAASATGREAACAQTEASILQLLESVQNLTEDQVVRQYLTLLNATLRTNYFQLDAAGEPKAYFSFKFDVAKIPEAPKPRPMFEIFVYSPRLEGVHLRGGKVARGGLRWSDRHEDFRTEVLGLVKAQQVKNSVIVPMGAKGGFVCKQAPSSDEREAFLAEGVACYKTFICALLDITDNLQQSEVVAPENTVRWDEDDPYLVVAADKGTATFSDIANGISQQYGFWLGDAFASGGSVGYDHKGMGITAKGAWVSVQRHFRELGLNVQQQDFTVVGVGDMGGDVFGNGMLCSPHIQLVAAFNHMHIFVDPNPDSASSYTERQRLFDMPRSSWDDYEKALISSGGGVFLRSAKSIPISAQMQARFGISVDQMTPNELIKAILKAPVDLFWNGGIGTYAKSSQETHADVGDRANDNLRVDASELGARVVGEGGNLGLTQLARVEYGLAGGRCNTDFIDNAAGVDCSDHEVNIKILLNSLIAGGTLPEAERTSLLESMTDAVSELVLENNYRQTQAISLAEYETHVRAVEYRRFISFLEAQGKLDRELEYLPADDLLAERKSSGHALTRAELSVLVSYAKLALKEALAQSDVADDEYIAQAAPTAFPVVLRENYGQQIGSHQLHSEIVATQVAGDLVNRMGITFVQRMQEATGENEAAIAKAYVTARDLFDIEAHWQQIAALDYQVSSELQHEMFAHLVRLVRRSTRWLLRSRRARLNPAGEIAEFGEAAAYLAEHIGELLTGDQRESWAAKVATYVEQGIDEKLAKYVAGARYFYTAFAISQARAESGDSLGHVASCYFTLGHQLELNWFADQIVTMGVENYWQAMARESFRDDLEEQQAKLTCNLSKETQAAGGECQIDEWSARHETYIGRWQSMMTELRSAPEVDLAMFPVAIRELLDLVQVSQS